MHPSSWPSPPAVPANGVVEPRSGPARALNLVVAGISLVTVAIVVAKAVTWDGSSRDDPEVRAVIGLALAALVLMAIVQAVVGLVAVGLLLARRRSGFALHLVASATAAVPIMLRVPIAWWWPALVAPVAFVVALAGLASDELR